MDFTRLISQHRSKADEISSLQKLIFSINENNFDNIKDQILHSKFTLTKESFRILIATIGIGFHTRPQQYESFVDLICSLKDLIKKFLTPHELYNVLRLEISNFFLLELISHQIMLFSDLFSIPRDDGDDFQQFFAPELIIYNRAEYESKFKDMDLQKHIKTRETGENESQIASIIMRDDINEFINYVSQTNIQYNSEIPDSIYEKCFYLTQKYKKITVIEYCAFFGSINIFKYLVSNKATETNNLGFYSIAGGCFEIVHLCEQMNCNFSAGLKAALIFHQYDVLDYLLSNGYTLDHNMIYSCIEGFNYWYFYQLFNDQIDRNMQFPNGNTLIIFTMKHMYSEFGIAISSLSGVDFNRTDIVSFFLYFVL